MGSEPAISWMMPLNDVNSPEKLCHKHLDYVYTRRLWINSRSLRVYVLATCSFVSDAFENDKITPQHVGVEKL